MKILTKILLLATLFIGFNSFAYAENPTINLTLRSGNTIVFDGQVPLNVGGTTNLDDTSGTPHPLNSNSLLSLLHTADLTDENWNISNLQYFDSFGAFYLKCITSIAGNDCDNWQFTINGSTSFASMDQSILMGGENVYIYFGPQNRIIFNSSNISTSDTLVVTAQNYDYENNDWTERSGVTVGLTKPNPSDAFNPTEVSTSPVDANGQATFTSIPEGTYNVGIKEDYYFPTEVLTVNKPSSGGGGSANISNSSGSSSRSSFTPKGLFDLDKALGFLVSNQKMDGSFGEDMYTDWAAVALSTSSKHALNKSVLEKNLTEKKLQNASLTDLERHTLALMSLGVNPYNVNGENYIGKIIATFDGNQFGDSNEDNDDIFALIILQNCGFKIEDPMIKNSVKFILNRQKENGSWDESVDMTGAGIESLAVFKDTKEVDDALDEARQFLKQNQKEDGGWINVSSTSWAMEGIMALNEKISDWKNGNRDPFNFLGANQESDGGIIGPSILLSDEAVLNIRTWETAYAINALSGKSWNQTMPHFEKPAITGAVLGTSVKAKPKIIANKKPLVAPVSIDPIKNETANPPTQNWFMKLVNLAF